MSEIINLEIEKNDVKYLYNGVKSAIEDYEEGLSALKRNDGQSEKEKAASMGSSVREYRNRLFHTKKMVDVLKEFKSQIEKKVGDVK